MTFSFKEFVNKNKPEQANMVDALELELGIPRSALPDVIDSSGPVELEDEGLVYNQAIWQLIKPIEPNDMYVRIRFMKTKSPDFVRAYKRGPDGKLTPYQGNLEGRIHLIPIQKFAAMFGRALKASLAQGGQQ